MQKLALLIIAWGLLFYACGNKKQNSSENSEMNKTEQQKLMIEDYDFAVLGNKKFISYNKAIYQRGDEVFMALKNVGPFARGTDSLNRAEMKMEIFNAIGETVSLREKLFGEHGHADFKNNVLKQPYASYQTDNHDEIGKYTFKITIYDLVSGDSTSVSDDFYIE